MESLIENDKTSGDENVLDSCTKESSGSENVDSVKSFSKSDVKTPVVDHVHGILGIHVEKKK